MAGFLLSERDFGRVSRVVRKIEGQVDSRFTSDISQPFLPQPTSVAFYNSTTETIPAHAVMRITKVTMAGKVPYLSIAKPSTTFARSYAVNGPAKVPKSKFGQCYTNGLVRFAYDTGTPAVGDGYGVKPAQWTASKNYPTVLDCFGIVDATNKIALGYLHPIAHIIGKLATDLASGSSATVNVWAGVASSEAVIASMTVTGYGWPKELTLSNGASVSVDWRDGIAYISHNATSAQMIRGTLGSALTTTTASVTISNPVSMDGLPIPSGTIIGYNEYTTKGMSGPSGAECVAAWNQTSSHYEFIWVEGIVQTMVTDYQIVTATRKFQKKTRSLVGWWDGNESAWTDVHTGDTCP